MREVEAALQVEVANATSNKDSNPLAPQERPIVASLSLLIFRVCLLFFIPFLAEGWTLDVLVIVLSEEIICSFFLNVRK